MTDAGDPRPCGRGVHCTSERRKHFEVGFSRLILRFLAFRGLSCWIPRLDSARFLVGIPRDSVIPSRRSRSSPTHTRGFELIFLMKNYVATPRQGGTIAKSTRKRRDGSSGTHPRQAPACATRRKSNRCPHPATASRSSTSLSTTTYSQPCER
jgi:hypothetical protein